MITKGPEGSDCGLFQGTVPALSGKTEENHDTRFQNRHSNTGAPDLKGQPTTTRQRNEVLGLKPKC